MMWYHADKWVASSSSSKQPAANLLLPLVRHLPLLGPDLFLLKEKIGLDWWFKNLSHETLYLKKKNLTLKTCSPWRDSEPVECLKLHLKSQGAFSYCPLIGWPCFMFLQPPCTSSNPPLPSIILTVCVFPTRLLAAQEQSPGPSCSWSQSLHSVWGLA